MSAGVPDGLTAGLMATISAEVTAGDTAQVLGSGDVPVLGTPRLLALAEAAAVAAVAPRLAPGQTTVGTAVRLEHRRPSPVGTRLEVEAELTEVRDRRLVFVFVAYEVPPGEPAAGAARRRPAVRADAGAGEAGSGEHPVIGAGTVQRVLVDRDRFLAGARVAGRP